MIAQDTMGALSQLRAQADVAQLALQRLEDKLSAWQLPRASQTDSARQLQRQRIERQLHESKIAVARLLLELDRAGLDGRR